MSMAKKCKFLVIVAMFIKIFIKFGTIPLAKIGTYFFSKIYYSYL